jgi:hypothetical protein
MTLAKHNQSNTSAYPYPLNVSVGINPKGSLMQMEAKKPSLED